MRRSGWWRERPPNPALRPTGPASAVFVGHTEDFLGYAPDLNPDEGVWGWAKYGRLANLAANHKDDLWDHVVEELVEVKFRPDLLRGFIRQTRLPDLSLAA